MNKFLNNLGLIKDIEMTFDVEKSEFVKNLKKKIKPNRTIFLDIFNSEEVAFYGNVNQDKFWIRSAKLSGKNPFADAKGSINRLGNQTLCKITIKGFNHFFIVWLLTLLFIFALSFRDITNGDSLILLFVFFSFFIIPLIFMFFKIRQGVKYFEKYLRSEL